MALARTGYQLHFEDIAPSEPRLGSAAVVPWDSDTFGFGVATYRAAVSELGDIEKQAFGRHFSSWMRVRSVAVCSCSVAAESHFWREALQQADFHFVDLTLQSSLAGLAGARLPECRFPVRLATRMDHAAIKEIAARSFAHGRYHADPRFPQTLADLRYRVWIESALNAPNPEDRIFILAQDGEVKGFFHATLEGPLSDLRLAAIAQDVKSTMFGVELYAGTLRELRNLGVRKVVTSVSGNNTAVMNLYAALGFRFGQPEMVYHWHARPFS